MGSEMCIRDRVVDTLTGGKSTRYRHAARHLAECQASDAAIEDYAGNPSQTQFFAVLKQEHGRKHGCWRLVEP